jgi:hypothetical protein
MTANIWVYIPDAKKILSYVPVDPTCLYLCIVLFFM